MFKVTARDQGHYKGPLGAFVKHCNISCCFFFLNNGKETSYYGDNEVAKRLGSERCEKYRGANSPVRRCKVFWCETAR